MLGTSSLIRRSGDLDVLADDEIGDLTHLRFDAPSAFLGVVNDVIAFALGLLHPGAS